MDECEYCGEQAEFDVIADGNYLRVCKRCLNDDMVLVQKPSKQQVDWSYKRPTVKQILSRMSGAPSNPIEKLPNPAPNLSMLRQSTKESEVKRRLTSMKRETPDQGRQIVIDRAPKQPSIASNPSPEKKDEIEAEDEFLDI